MAQINAEAETTALPRMGVGRALKILLHEYYELTKPERTLANVITALSGYLLASKWHVHWRLLIATLVGVALVIGSACVLNNYFDRKIDKKMPRTKQRVLANDGLPTAHVFIYAAMLGIVGFVILGAYVNALVVILGAIAFIDYVVLYGITKRRTPYGALIGTISGSMSIVAGYCAVTGRLDWGAVILFLILVFWQMPHFYAIAIYRLKDYTAAHIPVLPAKIGIKATKVHIVAYAAAFVVVVSLLTVFGYTGYTYLAVMLLLSLSWLWLSIRGFKASDDVRWAKQLFFFSLIVNLAMAAMIPLGALLP